MQRGEQDGGLPSVLAVALPGSWIGNIACLSLRVTPAVLLTSSKLAVPKGFEAVNHQLCFSS
jgi:hypothetical protein